MLIGNYSVLNKSPGIFTGGVQQAMNRSTFNTSNSMRGVYYGDAGLGFDKKSGIALGYLQPYNWFLPQKSGAIASNTLITGTGTLSPPTIAGGLNGVCTIEGSGAISNANMGLIISLVATLTGEGQISNAQGQAILNMVATLTGSSTFDNSTLGALVNIIATIGGTGSISDADMNAIGSMSADITPFAELSPQSLAASLWNSIAASYNEAGTMGEKLNAAGTAGDPWTAELPGSYVAGTAGYIVGNGSGGLTTEEHNQLMALLKKSTYIALK